LRAITIPPVTEASWSKPVAFISCITAPVFILFAIKLLTVMVPISSHVGIPLCVFVLILGGVCAVIVFLKTRQSEPPPFLMVFVVAGFIVASTWLYLTAIEIVFLLQEVCNMMNWSNTIIGLLILAWGNALSDLISNVILAKQGFAEAAVASSFAAPPFNILIGLGISLLYKCATLYPEKLSVTMDNGIIVGYVFMAFCLCVSLVVIPISKFRLSKKFAILLLAIYCAFVIITTLTELRIIFPNPLRV